MQAHDLTWRGRPFFDKTLTEITGINGMRWTFHGLRTNPDNVRSMEGVDLAIIEEARRVSKYSLEEVLIPTIRVDGSEIWAIWNPEQPDDPIDALFRGPHGPPPRSMVCQMSWQDNPYFTEANREAMEYDRARDPVLAGHVWDGEYLQRSDAQVFKNWRVEECEPPEDARILMGGDFGFGLTDPTCGVGCWIDGKTLYIDREVWALRLPLDDLPAFFAGSDTQEPARWQNDAGWPGLPGAMDWPLRLDSSRPDLIALLASRGVPAQASTKGAGSVRAGVDWLASYDIVVHPRCVRMIGELKAYKFKVDKITGEVLPQLVDAENHMIDSLRYAVELQRRANVVY